MPLQATSGAASYDAFGGGVAAVPNYIEDVFSTFLYTGTGVAQTITNGIDLAGKGGLVWIKQRSGTGSNGLIDTARGRASILYSNTAGAATTDSSSTEDLTSFNSNGFSLGSQFNFTCNSSGQTFASWTFEKQAKFFDVVTYTGNGSSLNVSHALTSVPGCVMIKRLNSTSDWVVAHRGSGSYWASETLRLNTTAAGVTNGEFNQLTDTYVRVVNSGAGYGDVNTNGASYVMYLFAHNAGGFGLSGTDNVISCGSYTGTGAAGNAISLGYEPQWVMIKRTNDVTNWALFDNMRGMPDTADSSNLLFPNASAAEATGQNGIAPTATGFKILGTSPTINASGGSYIYIAIRRGPMRTPTTGTSVYNAIARTGTGSETNFTGAGFTPDYAIIRNRTVEDWVVADRLRGGAPFLATNGGGAEQTAGTYLGSATFSSTMDGIRVVTAGAVNAASKSYINYLFRRAPGFFDEVCYTGTGSARTLAHNLTVAPELLIVKDRSQAAGWRAYAAPLGAGFLLQPNSTAAAFDDSPSFTTWNNTSPTASVFSLGAAGAVNASGDNYVAYLFASAPGVSKVGSFTGTGATQVINCGFTGGARFVMIKRTDSTGDWYVWDTARGIVSGNDPHLSLNTTAAEVTSNDTIDTDSTGFVVNQVSATNVNVSSATYIFLAIA